MLAGRGVPKIIHRSLKGVADSHARPSGLIQIDGLLGVEPKVGRHSETGAELERHLGPHRGTPVDDAIDHLHVAAQVIGV